ncbi:MAG: DUF934 domain-containing protein, partial [Casimicrobium sp.]
MPKLIDRRGERMGDPWIAYASDVSVVPVGSCVILPFAHFHDLADTLTNRAKALGILLSPSDDPASIAKEFDKLRLIAIDFPSFTDGRGYSIAQQLRTRYGWTGELRAVGDIQRDQVFLLSRAGFDTFALRDDQDAAISNAAFNDFSVAYQASVDTL